MIDDTILAGISAIIDIPVIQPKDSLKRPIVDLDAFHEKSLILLELEDGEQVRKKMKLGTVEGEFPIYVKTLSGGNHTLSVSSALTVEEVKCLLHKKNVGIIGPPDGQRFIFKGQELENKRTLSYYNIRNESIIHLVLRLRGGGDGYVLEPGFLDPQYDYVYPLKDESKTEFSRGNTAFERPYGWEKKALKVLGRYENNDWLGVTRKDIHESVDDEWPVSYHGTNQKAASEICKDTGYILEKGKRFRYGKGIYSSPTPEVAEEYAKTFHKDGSKYKVMIMNRVDMRYTATKDVPGVGTYFK